jgi:hypothetical protein
MRGAAVTDDLYGYDRKLEALLGLPPVPES